MKKVLFIASHRLNRSPGQRFRFEQYLSHLTKNGYSCDVSYLISEDDDIIFYKKGKLFRKLIIIIRSYLKRLRDAVRAGNYDLVFISRESFMTGSLFFEKQFRRSGTKIIYDFDDSIWLLDTSYANKKYEWLKDPNKTSKIISLSHMVFAGNRYLADYAAEFNSNVKIMPTTIDADKYKRMPVTKIQDVVCIGWTGSITTIKHFEYAIPFLKKIMEKYGNRVRIHVIGDGSYENEELKINGIPWHEKNELKELSFFDIGIMPLPDNEWTKGKCGLKGLQYMALEIPAIMSPVGVNTEIVNDGINGFLAGDENEWIEKLSRLIDDKSLREKIGKEARKTVMEKYSVDSQKNNYLNYFNELINR